MTTQIENCFHYQEKDYRIAGILEDDLFFPRDYDLHPVQASTACYRGYYAVFTVSESRLFLERLDVRLVRKTEDGYKEQKGPPINGVAPHFNSDGIIFNNQYDGLHLPLPYTGGLLLIDGPINDAPFRVWEYSTVFELLFEDGVLQNAIDRSAAIENLRNTISECFELTYML